MSGAEHLGPYLLEVKEGVFPPRGKTPSFTSRR